MRSAWGISFHDNAMARQHPYCFRLTAGDTKNVTIPGIGDTGDWAGTTQANDDAYNDAASTGPLAVSPADKSVLNVPSFKIA